jgi:dimethyl sulfoxide reductase membrane subunit
VGKAKGRFGYTLWLTILSVLILAALFAWIYELRFGLKVTGMRDVISWGLYIITFTFFVKLSAGGLIVASSAEVFGVKALKPLSKLGVLTAAVCVSVAALSIIPDLGKPQRIFNLFIYPNFQSPMIWDVTIILLYFLLSISELCLLSSRQTASRKRTLKWLAVIGLPAAFALHSITAFIFGLQISRPFWNTALMAPLFVVSAILSGTALVTMILWILERFGSVRLGQNTWRNLSVLLASSLAIDLFFTFCDYLTVLWGRVPKDMQALHMLLPGGRFQTLFWLEWVVGGLIPFLMLVIPAVKRRVGLMAIGSLLILCGVYSFQTELVTVGMANPLVQLPPGISLGTFSQGASSFQLTGSYSPTWVEYLIVLGLAAVSALFITLGYKYFQIRDALSAPLAPLTPLTPSDAGFESGSNSGNTSPPIRGDAEIRGDFT